MARLVFGEPIVDPAGLQGVKEPLASGDLLVVLLEAVHKLLSFESAQLIVVLPGNVRLVVLFLGAGAGIGGLLGGGILRRLLRLGWGRGRSSSPYGASQAVADKGPGGRRCHIGHHVSEAGAGRSCFNVRCLLSGFIIVRIFYYYYYYFFFIFSLLYIPCGGAAAAAEISETDI